MLDLEIQEQHSMFSSVSINNQYEVLLMVKGSVNKSSETQAKKIAREIDGFRRGLIGNQREDELAKPPKNQFEVRSEKGDVVLKGNVEHIFDLLRARGFISPETFDDRIKKTAEYVNAVANTALYRRPDYIEPLEDKSSPGSKEQVSEILRPHF